MIPIRRETWTSHVAAIDHARNDEQQDQFDDNPQPPRRFLEETSFHMSAPSLSYWPDLTPEQTQLLLDACVGLPARRLPAGSRRMPIPTWEVPPGCPWPGHMLPKRGAHIRRAGQLREQPTTLGEAVADALYQAAFEDARFPPISPAELTYLDVEVWLLFNRQRLPLRREERLSSVDPGKHGLSVLRMGQRGLLLPDEAAANHWDARAVWNRCAAMRACGPACGRMGPRRSPGLKACL